MNQRGWYSKLESNGAIATNGVYPHMLLMENYVVDVYWDNDLDARNKFAKELRKDGYDVTVSTMNTSHGAFNSLVAIKDKSISQEASNRVLKPINRVGIPMNRQVNATHESAEWDD